MTFLRHPIAPAHTLDIFCLGKNLLANKKQRPFILSTRARVGPLPINFLPLKSANLRVEKSETLF